MIVNFSIIFVVKSIIKFYFYTTFLTGGNLTNDIVNSNNENNKSSNSNSNSNNSNSNNSNSNNSNNSFCNYSYNNMHQMKSGAYFHYQFLVVKAALHQSIIPIAIDQQWSLFNRIILLLKRASMLKKQ